MTPALLMFLVIRWLHWMMYLATVDDNAYDLHVHCYEDNSACWVEDHNRVDDHRYWYITFDNGD